MTDWILWSMFGIGAIIIGPIIFMAIIHWCAMRQAQRHARDLEENADN